MMDKKIRKKIPQESKIRAELQKEISSCCPFCNSEEVGHFQIHHIDENPENNKFGNLLLLCSMCHSKITKGDILKTVVFQKKIELLAKSKTTKDNTIIDKSVNFNAKVENAVVGNNNKIIIKQQEKTIKQKYPEGCIGFDNIKANYIGYLIKRYNEYKENEIGKNNMNYAIFSAQLKKKYKIGTTRTIYNLPIEKFEGLVGYIQMRIDKTTFSKMLGKGHKNYSTFEEYIEF